MEIKVDVSQLEAIDLSTAVGERLVYDDEAEERIPEVVTLGDIVAEKLVEKLVRETGYYDQRKTVLKLREEVIREKLSPMVEEAIAAPIQKTNTFGEAVGSAITLRELIVTEVDKILKERRDRNGYANNKEATFLEKVIRKEIGAAFENEVKAAIDAEKAKIMEILRTSAAAVISKTVGDAAAILSTTTKQN